MDPEPGLISRRFGSRRDGKQEIIEVWDVAKSPHLVHCGGLITYTRRFWVPGIAAEDVRLYEAPRAQV